MMTFLVETAPGDRRRLTKEEFTELKKNNPRRVIYSKTKGCFIVLDTLTE